jgi:hypothetical protein
MFEYKNLPDTIPASPHFMTTDKTINTTNKIDESISSFLINEI